MGEFFIQGQDMPMYFPGRSEQRERSSMERLLRSHAELYDENVVLRAQLAEANRRLEYQSRLPTNLPTVKGWLDRWGVVPSDWRPKEKE